MRDLYAILGISRAADQASIRKAFKSLARKYHPDLNKDAGADERFKEVNAAYEVLGDEQRRNLYDTFGEDSLKQGFNPDAARQWRQATGGGGGGGFGGGGFGGGMNIDDLMNAFGGRFSGGGPRQQSRPPPRPRPQKAADIEQRLSCTIDDLLSEEKKIVEVRRPSTCDDCGGRGGAGKHSCPACAGTGRTKVGTVHFPCVACSGAGHRFSMECEGCGGTGRTMNEERFKVGIPPGVEDGQIIRLRGKGAHGQHGNPPGDLLLSIEVEKHDLYERDGNHLRLTVPLTVHEALVGTKIKVPTPDGAIRVTVPAGTTPGSSMRIKGRGLPKTKSKRGDLYLVMQPCPPVTDSKEAEALAAELDKFYETPLRADWD